LGEFEHSFALRNQIQVLLEHIEILKKVLGKADGMGVAMRVHAGGALVADSHVVFRAQVLDSVSTIDADSLVSMTDIVRELY
jgi:hypothetical protein